MGVTWSTFGILGPLISGGRLKQEISNLAQRWIAVSTNEKNAKLGQKGSCGVMSPTFGILGSPNISGTVKDRNFKFCHRDGWQWVLTIKCKTRSTGVMWGSHVTHFWNFGTHLISRVRLMLETSNLAQRWTAVSTNEKNAKLGQKGSGGVTWPTFAVLVPLHLRNDWD